MKKICIIVFTLLLTSCIGQEEGRVEPLSIDVLKALNKSNIEYLKKEAPSNDHNYCNSTPLLKADSIINVFIKEIDDNQVNIEEVVSFIDELNKDMILFGNSIPLYSGTGFFKNQNKHTMKYSLHLIEYIYGNYLIKFNSSYSFKMEMAYVINKSRADTLNIGDNYESQFFLTGYNILAPYYIEIDGEKVNYPSSGEAPIYKVKAEKKGANKKYGKFYYYNSADGKYLPLNFSFEFFVK